MSDIGQLLIRLGVSKGPLTAGLAEAKAEVSSFGNSVNKTSGSSIAAMRVASLAVVGGVAAIGAAAVDMGVKFQDAMTTVQINAHLSGAATTALGQAIESTAIGTTASANTMAAALAPVAGELQRVAGGSLSAASATAVLTAAQNLTQASGTDLTTTVKSLTDLMLVYHQHTSAAAADANLLQAAHAQLGVGVDTLSGQLQRLQPKIAGSGVSLQTLLAVARELEPTVGTGQRAVLTMGTVLQLFTVPSKAADKAMAALHISLTNAKGAFIGFGPALADINVHLAHLSPAQKAADLFAIFGKNVGIATALLKGGASGLASSAAALTAQGTAAAQAALKQKDLGAQLDTLKASASTALTALGGALIPAISKLAAVVIPVVDGITRWVEANPQLAAQILAIVGGVALLGAAVAFLGPILAGIGTIIGIIASPIVLVIGAILGLAAHFGLLGKGAQDTFDGIVDTITKAIPGVIGTLGDMASRVVSWIAAQIPVWLNQLAQWARAFIGWIGPMIPPALAALGQWAGQVLGWIVAQIPVWAVNLGKLALQFVAWVLPMIPKVLGALAQWGLQVIGWVIGQLPALEAALNRWGNAAIAWVVNSIPGLLGALGNWLTQVLQWVQGVLGTIYNAFLGFGGQIAKGIIDGIGNIAKAVGDKLNTIPGVSLVGGVVAFGGSVVSNTIGGAAQLGSNVVNTVTGGGASKPPPTFAGHFALGGLVPGGIGSDALAIVHGGEMILPPSYFSGPSGPGLPSGGGGGTTLTLHTHIEIGGQPLIDYIEKALFGNASGFSSGFQAPAGVTGA